MGAVVQELQESPKVYKKPAYRKRVEKILREYPILKKSLEIEEQLEREGLGDMFPSLTSVYGEGIGGYSEYRSDTERYGILRAAKKSRIQAVERGLQALNLDERYLIEERYLNVKRHLVTDITIYEDLGWSRRQYYRVKEQALKKLATVLNLV